MEKYRVWGYLKTDYEDVNGKSLESVARRFFGKSTKLGYHLGDDGTWTITKDGSVQGRIREMSC